MTTREAALALGVSMWTVRRYCERDFLKFRRPPWGCAQRVAYQIDRDSVDRILTGESPHPRELERRKQFRLKRAAISRPGEVYEKPRKYHREDTAEAAARLRAAKLPGPGALDIEEKRPFVRAKTLAEASREGDKGEEK